MRCRRAELTVDDSHAERALYLLEGDARLDGVDLPTMHLIVLDPGPRPRAAQGDAAGRSRTYFEEFVNGTNLVYVESAATHHTAAY